VVLLSVVIQNRGSGLDMNVIPAWNNGYTGQGVVVSILDDGIEKDHPDLKRNYVRLVHQLSVQSYGSSLLPFQFTFQFFV